MSPVLDPRFAKPRWRETLEWHRNASARTGRSRNAIPIVMLVAGSGASIALLRAGGELEMPLWLLVGTYVIALVGTVICGMLGIWAACKLWLGGVGSCWMAALRLAGIYAVVDATSLLAIPLYPVSLMICTLLHFCLLGWLFELDAGDALLLGIVTGLVNTWIFIIFLGAVG